MKYLTQWQAAELLASLLNGDAKKWYGFLAKNSRHHADQSNGYKITTHVVNGKLTYTESALLEFIRVTLTPHKETIEVNQLPSLSDESISEIALNIIDENDGDFDLKTEAGIDEACRFAVYYYKVAGFELKCVDIKRELNRKIRALKELELM
ncbi:hypothetical protein HLH14_04500 [Acinetobacter sp. ANC 4282]|uniref:hypothetical protein n=1 Tax=Acinetobacter terrae TaxID=2731247 RepID=UPI00148FA6BB|nr:hypothetical protein [Acinetobacter terrae]NNH15278.1 hypothetical protein [Acinetobacter terrae]